MNSADFLSKRWSRLSESKKENHEASLRRNSMKKKESSLMNAIRYLEERRLRSSSKGLNVAKNRRREERKGLECVKLSA